VSPYIPSLLRRSCSPRLLLLQPTDLLSLGPSSYYDRPTKSPSSLSSGLLSPGRRSTRRADAEQALPAPSCEEEQLPLEAEEAQNDVEEAQGVAEETQQDIEGATIGDSTASGSSSVYLRGPAILPKRPIPLERRSVIQHEGER
jgi:hypothetical protein